MKDILDKNKGFSGEYEFLSNFYPCQIVYNGITYPSVEHAYQAAKTKNIKDKKRIAACLQASTAKMIGREIKPKDNWDEIKFKIMLSLVAQKFYKHKHLREKLISTKDGEWSTLKAYATEEQRDMAFEQMHKNYVSEISEIRKANREEVNTCD